MNYFLTNCREFKVIFVNVEPNNSYKICRLINFVKNKFVLNK